MEPSSPNDSKRRTTGIGGLDYALEGGFPTGTSIVAFGSPISGLDLMARQFWKTEDEQGTYLMIDAPVVTEMVDVKETPLPGLSDLMKKDRIVVDSLSSLVLNHGIDAAVKFMTADTREIRERGSNILFVFYAHLHSPVEEMRIIRAADVFIELRQTVHGNEVERSLAIHKIKGSAVPERLVPFIITEKGLELSTTSRVV